MRLFLCVSCVLGFASLPALKASTSPATPAPASPSATIAPVKLSSLPTVIQGSTIGDAAMKPSAGTSAGVDTLKPSATALVVGVVTNNVPTTPSSMQVLPTSVSATVITMSASGPQGSAGTVATVSKHKESSSKPSSLSESASFFAPTVAALTPPTSNGGTLGTSTPDRSKPSLAHTQLSSTSAESKTPGSSVTGQSMTSAVSSVTEGHHATAGPTPSKETSELPPKNVVLDSSSEATSTVSGSSTPVIPPEKPGTSPSTTSVSSTRAKIIWSLSLPGDQQRVSSSPSTSEVPGSIPSGKLETYYFPGIKLTCFLQDFPNQSLVIQTQGNMPSVCNDGTLKHAKELLAVLCETVKPGFKFSENKDNCTVKLAHKSEQPHKLAVLEVSVKTNAAAEDIDKALKGRTEELKKLGFLLDNKSGIDSLETYEDRISIPLIISIVCLAATLLLIAAIYSCCHQRRRHRKDQRLTEELQTMENGYHDNPTLEVMETSPEMQEKKPGLNGDLGDSWIVPMDNLTKDDMDDEEDTHL